jgi:hypothetical protein
MTTDPAEILTFFQPYSTNIQIIATINHAQWVSKQHLAVNMDIDGNGKKS